MKRFIAVFGILVIITMHCLSFYPANATISGVDYGEMLNTYLGAAETALAASQGVTIDWSNLDMPSGSENWTNQQKAQYVVQYVGNLKKVGQHAIYDWLFGEDNDTQDIISSETAAIGLANSSNIDTLDIKSQLDQALLYYDQQNRPHIFQRYSDKVIARWNEYNTNYINDYLDEMDETETIYYPDTSQNVSIGSIKVGNNTNSFSAVQCQKFNFYDESQWVYDCYYPCGWKVYRNNQLSHICVIGANLSPQMRNYNYYVVGFYNINYDGFIYPIFESEADAIQFSRTGYIISGGNIGFTLPNAVIDSSSEDGKIVAHPIYYPDTMNTDKALDIDLDKVVDAIAAKIGQGIDSITFDDIVDAGAAVKLDGTTLTDTDTVVKDVSIPIARAKVDTIDGVIPTIDVVPPLPPLPALNPGDYSGEGFNGMSVLARIINATVQGLPAPLILTFFGVVFGAVILGIIKILHH